MSETLVAPAAAASPAKTPGRPFLPAFDGMRGFFGIYIGLAHLFARLTQVAPPLFGVPHHYVGFGHSAIGMFIVISGYVLGLPVARAGQTLRGGWRTFAKRRARRILPAYYAALLLAIPISLLVAQHFGDQLPTHTFLLSSILHLFMLQNVSNSSITTIDGPMWSVAVECDIYILFPLLLIPFARRFGFVAMVVAACAVGLLPTALGALRHEFVYYPLAQTCPWFLGLFALGYAAANLSVDARPSAVRIVTDWPWGRIALAFALAGVATILATPVELDRTGEGTHWLQDLLIGIAIAAQFTADAQARARGKQTAFARFFSFRPLLFLGTFSYSFYLVHLPILDLIMSFARPGWSRVALCAFGFGAFLVALGVAYVFYRIVERPFMTEYRRRGDAASLRSSAVTEIPDDADPISARPGAARGA